METSNGPLLTLPEIALRVGISDTTARNWARAYGDLIAQDVGPHGYQRYSLRRFERIAELRQQKLPTAAIRAALGAEPEPAGESAPSVEERRLALIERLVVAVERIADRLDPPPEEG